MWEPLYFGIEYSTVQTGFYFDNNDEDEKIWIEKKKIFHFSRQITCVLKQKNRRRN